MDRELPHDKIPVTIRKKAKAKGVATAIILVLFLGLIEVIAFHVVELRMGAQMKSAPLDLWKTVLVFGAIVLTPILAVLGWKNGNYAVVQKWYLDALATNATRDNLTGVLNHRGIVNKLEHAAAIARRRKSPLTLVFVDIMDLETVNEKFGATIGDRVVVGTARALMHTMRQTDIIGRLRNDEFLVALIDCELAEAESVMERAAQHLAKRGLAEVGEPWTMKWGCAAYTENDSAEQLVSHAIESVGHQNNALPQAQRN